jgi:serine/threonine-protein kinase HipA
VRRFVADEAHIDPLNLQHDRGMRQKNTPGAVTAEKTCRVTLQRLVTQNQDAMEATVWAEPFQDALSILQAPKIG